MLLQLLVLLPHQLQAVRILHRGVPENASVKHQIQEQLVEQPVMIVEEVPVPVVEVVVEGGLEPEVAPSADEPAMLDKACTEQLMALKMNATRFSEAQACEEKAAYTEQATAALKLADQPAALVAVESAYHRCMGLSQSCAKQAAPQLVTKVRFSGVAVTQQCKIASGAVKSGADTNTCERNMTTAMVADLKRQNIDAVMLAAQHGLSSCYHVVHPCDFQLAPILVMQLIQSVMGQAQQQIAQVLLAGINAAEDVSTNLLAAEDSQRKPVAGSSHLSSPGHQQKQLPQKQTQPQKLLEQAKPETHHTATHSKKLSLLSIDDNLVLKFQRHSVQL
jgi:hypothetical protein